MARHPQARYIRVRLALPCVARKARMASCPPLTFALSRRVAPPSRSFMPAALACSRWRRGSARKTRQLRGAERRRFQLQPALLPSSRPAAPTSRLLSMGAPMRSRRAGLATQIAYTARLRVVAAACRATTTGHHVARAASTIWLSGATVAHSLSQPSDLSHAKGRAGIASD